MVLYSFMLKLFYIDLFNTSLNFTSIHNDHSVIANQLHCLVLPLGRMNTFLNFQGQFSFVCIS